MTVENENYVHACFLRYCGQIEGCKDARLPVYDEHGKDEVPITAMLICDDEGNVVGEKPIKSVLDAIWAQISKENCVQYCAGRCLTRLRCEVKQTHCYPVPVAGKLPNKLVAVMFAWYCADVAENAAAASAARYASAAAAASDAADAASHAGYAAHAAHAACSAAARYQFYLADSQEIERLVNAWGTPIKKDSEQP